MTQEPGSIHLQRHACSTLSALLLPQIDTWASVFYSGRLSTLPATIDYCLLCELLGGFWESPTRIRTSGDPRAGILIPHLCVLRFPYPPKPARQERGACPVQGFPSRDVSTGSSEVGKLVTQDWTCLSWSGHILSTEVKGLKTWRPMQRGLLH